MQWQKPVFFKVFYIKHVEIKSFSPNYEKIFVNTHKDCGNRDAEHWK